MHGVVVRTFAQSRLVQFAAAAPKLHVVNALTDEEHPCQALADMLTLKEQFGELQGRTIAFVGDGNNVAASLAQAGAMLGVHVRIASPTGFELPAAVVESARRRAAFGATVTVTNDPIAAVAGRRRDLHRRLGVDGSGRSRPKRARACSSPIRSTTRSCPPRAGTPSSCIASRPIVAPKSPTAVIDSSASVVFDQAENRLHTQKALLAMLMGG